MQVSKLSVFALASTATAFPWMANIPGIDLSALPKEQQQPAKRQNVGSCPFNADHPGAAPYDPAYPYTGAINGLPGTGVGGVPVPAPGDTAHEFEAPGQNDIRGPCPGMNTAANHHFLSHDGITNLPELVDAQQNLYNLGYGLAVFIAVRAIALDGDIVTTKISIGCDATSRTAADGGLLLGPEPGLDAHNKFEADTSLTRNDYFLADGDNFSFNGSLFAQMYNTAKETSNGNFDRATIAKYRSDRYDESLNTNPNFYFGPKSLLLYGAASFVYENFPVFGGDGIPDIDTISSFFGAVDNGDGTYSHVPERIPPNWSNRRTAYTLPEIAEEIAYQYGNYPKLFGGNAGVGNFLVLESFGDLIRNGTIPSDATAGDFLCLLYQLAVDNVPGYASNEPELPLEAITFILTQINPVFENEGCELKII